MRGNRQKLWFAVCGTSLGLLLAIAGAGAQSTAPNAPAVPAGPKLAEEEFKNIQALKGIPADQVIPSMQFIAASRGVECEYCHVAHANEKDDKKPNVTARKMINLMMAINERDWPHPSVNIVFALGSWRPSLFSPTPATTWTMRISWLPSNPGTKKCGIVTCLRT